jgi:hypothetical protein
VIDTKYASAEVPNQYGGSSFHNDHVYQAVFYALCLGCPALLVYPRTNRDVNTTFNVAGVSTTILTVDLTGPDLLPFDTLLKAIETINAQAKTA